MESVHEETYRGLKIEIIPDDGHGCHPRQDCDNFTTMVCFHRRYDLGDKHEYTPESLREYFRDEKELVAIPLYLYDHSGISISCRSFIGRAQHAEWDSGQVGFIYMTKKSVLENWPNCKQWRVKAQKVMEQDVKVYDDYLRGNVYGYRILNAGGEELDSCWGYIGDHDGYILKEAKSIVDYMTNKGSTDEHGQQLMGFAQV